MWSDLLLDDAESSTHSICFKCHIWKLSLSSLRFEVVRVVKNTVRPRCASPHETVSISAFFPRKTALTFSQDGHSVVTPSGSTCT